MSRNAGFDVSELVAVDVEATGLDPAVDRIISISIASETGTQSWLINPCQVIPAAVTELTGITDEDLAGKPQFSEVAKEILQALEGKTVVGFGSNRFDVPMIAEELARCNLSWAGWRDVIDAGELFKIFHPRNLSAAYSHYCNATLSGAHTSVADAAATRAVFLSQLNAHESLTDKSPRDISLMSKHDEEPADPHRKLIYRDGVMCFGTHRNNGVPIEHDPGYARWMLGIDFPQSTLDILAAEMERLGIPESESSWRGNYEEDDDYYYLDAENDDEVDEDEDEDEDEDGVVEDYPSPDPVEEAEGHS